MSKAPNWEPIVNDQTQQIIDAVLTTVRSHLGDADPLIVRNICLIGASELVAEAARAVSTEDPGMPVVELLLLSERIASLAVHASEGH